MKRVVHLLMSDYSVDSRVKNETISLAESGFDVTVFCLKGKNLPVKEVSDGVSINRFGLLGLGGKLRFFTALVSIITKSIFTKIDLVHAHDLNALPLAFLISMIKRSKLVYDSHELWSQAHHRKRLPLILKAVEKVELFISKRCDAVIAVSDGITDYLKSYFGINSVTTIRNIPSYQTKGSHNLFREEFGISDSTKIFLYQGLISESRGVNVILKAAESLAKKEGLAFVFLGDGPYAVEIINRIKNKNLGSVFYKKSVPQNILLNYTKSADVGVHAIKNSCLNHDLCLPNKLFEYLSAEKPVIVSNLKEMKSFVESYQVGKVFDESDSRSLILAIDDITRDPDTLGTLKGNIVELNRNLNWKEESKKLIELYFKVLGSESAR